MPTRNCSGCMKVIKSREGLQCFACKEWYDLLCANISDKRYKLMTLETRNLWKCPVCISKLPKKDNSNTPARSTRDLSPTTVTQLNVINSPILPSEAQRSETQNEYVDTLLKDITGGKLRDIIRQEIDQAFRDSIKNIINEHFGKINELISTFQDSLTFFNERYEEMKTTLEEKCRTINKLEMDNIKLVRSVNDMKKSLNTIEQHARSSNIELQCVPEYRNENLLNTVLQLSKTIKCDIKDTDILLCTRVAKLNTQSSRPRSIIVKFSSPRLRDTFLAATSMFNKKKDLTEKLNTSHLGIASNPPIPIYVTEHLSPINKTIYAAARLKSKEQHYKFVWVRQHIQTEDFDVYIFTETWLCSGIFDSEMFDGKFTVYRRDRETSSLYRHKSIGGGVLVAVSNKLVSSRMHNWESNCEDLWVTIELQSQKSNGHSLLKLCAVYLAPPIRVDVFDHFIDNCHTALERSCDNFTLIVGDFNLPGINWVTQDNAPYLITSDTSTGYLKDRLIDFNALHNLQQYNNIQNFQNKILDLILSDISEIRVAQSSNPVREVDRFHPPLEITPIISPKINKSIPRKKFLFHKANYNDINEMLKNINWNTELCPMEDVDVMVDKFYSIIHSIIKQCVPEVKTCGNKYPSWYSFRLIKLLNKKHNLHKRIKKYNNPMDIIEFKYLRKESMLLTKQCYSNYLKNIENSIKINPKYFWTHVKNLRKGNISYPSTMSLGNESCSNPKDICDLFAKYFSSVFNPSIVDLNYKSMALSNVSNVAPMLSAFSISSHTIKKALLALDLSKGPGPDNVPPIFLTRCASMLSVPLALIFNTSLNNASLTVSMGGMGVVGGVGGAGTVGACAECQQPHTHSRNSSNTSGDMSSKASGYGSSVSAASAHSRQSSEGDSAPDRPHHNSLRVERTTRTTTTLYVPRAGCKHAPRLAKLVIERTLTDTSDLYLSPDSTPSDAYLTPNATLTAQPDVIPRYIQSPASDEYRTPDSTVIEDGSFAMPTYFDKKKRAVSVISSVVQPLTNFQILKQKSLNTIPALVEKNRKNEELFTNFPFLTPLAHRKNSLVANRLSGCLEDEFYCIPSETEDQMERIDVRHRFKSVSNRALNEPLTSTPKAELLRHSVAECARNPSSGSLTASASESGSLERARAALERRKRAAAPPPQDDTQHAVSCRVENTRVNPDSLIDELLAATDLKQAVDDAAETSGLQLFITRDGTAELGSRQRQQLARRDYQRVVLHPHPHPHPRDHR
ncbi:unnamed protein product [Colias eurytheme]|nr:unnamed protein product [Colias eurytheme]